MRVRDHIALSTSGAALLYPLVGRRVLVAWMAGILIDVDHYLWFCWRERSLSPLAAYNFFTQADVPHDPATRVFHNPLFIPLVLMLGTGRKGAVPVAVGMAVHLVLDAFHESRFEKSREAALRRDSFTCQVCGSRGPGVVAHLSDQPPLLPSYAPENLISLCPSCHEAAHARAKPAVLRFASRISAMFNGMWSTQT